MLIFTELTNNKHSLRVQIFGWNVLGALVIIAWAAGVFAVVFGFLKLCKLLNITENEFEIGLDKLYHKQKGSAGTSLNRVKTKARTHYHSGGSTLGRFVTLGLGLGIYLRKVCDVRVRVGDLP